jgi:hypothetical protein
MRSFKKEYRGNKLVVETDFATGDGWHIDIGRSPQSHLSFVKYEIEGEKIEFGTEMLLGDTLLVPPAEDGLIRHVRLPGGAVSYKSISNLLEEIDLLLSQCLDISAPHRFLLTCFVPYTWVADLLPLSPYIALVGLPQSGKSTALRVLHLLCRRGLLTSDISSAGFYRACDALMPTVFIDEPATTSQQAELCHLLRSGNTRDFVVLRDKESYRTYGPKVVAWTELPNDDALNSRCIVIPMLESSRTDLLRATDPNIVERAASLQNQLLRFRLRRYSTVQSSQIPSFGNLRSRNRDLYEALALPIAEFPEACARLLECMEGQQSFQRQSLPPNQLAVLESLYQQIHARSDLASCAIRDLAINVNLNLERTGECLRLNPKGVGAVLTTLGFHARTRTNAGWVLWLDRGARKRIHEMVSRYGIDGLSSEHAAGECDFCDGLGRQRPEIPPADGSKK